MRIDLERALGSIADAAESSASPVRVDRVLTRMHRRRTGRAVASSAVGVGAVGAIALGASALTRDGLPGPVATTPSPTATTEPTTAPTAEPAALPPVMGASGPFECGAPVPTLDDPPGQAELRFAPLATHLPNALRTGQEPMDGQLDGMSMIEGEELVLDAVLVNDTAGDVDVTVPATAPLGIWLVQDDVVVGSVPISQTSELVTDADGNPVDPHRTLAGGPGTQWSQYAGGGVVDCVSADDPLPAGTYDVYITEGLFVNLGQNVLTTRRPDVTAVGGPYALTIEPNPAAPTQPPPLDSLIIDVGGVHHVDPEAGWDPITFVDPLPAEPAPADLIRWDPTYCEGTDVPGRWIASYPDATDIGGNPSPPFWLGTFEDRITRIDVMTPGVRSLGGIQVGATSAGLRAAHPDLTLVAPLNPDQPVELWQQQHNELTLVFEVAVQVPGAEYWQPEQVDRVVAISAMAGIPAGYPATGTERCG
ncbi:MAG: hypothetical protein JWP95_80 [Actinotalea sp.]|nr:hypothetical protein [Actinotalea sp.]